MFAMPTCTDGKVLSKYAEECWRPGSTVRHLERESMSDGILRVMSSPLSSLLYNTNPLALKHVRAAADDKLCSRCRTLMVVCVDRDCNCRNVHSTFCHRDTISLACQT